MAQIPKELIPIQDQKELDGFFREAAHTFAEITLWTKDREIVLKTKVLDYSSDNKIISVYLPADFDSIQFKASLEKKGTLDCFFNLFLSKASLLFKATFISLDDVGIQFINPDSVFRMQRRKDIRVTISSKFNMKVEFPDPLGSANPYKARLLDISEGGMSFVVNDLDEPLFPVENNLKPIKFNLIYNLKTWPLIAEGVIRYSRLLPPDSQIRGVKVGIQFTDISNDHRKVIQNFVLEESQKIFMRHV